MTLKSKLQRVPIGFRMAVMTAMIIGFGLGTFGVIYALRQREQTQTMMEDEARKLVESLESSLRVQMLRGDAHLKEAVTNIARPEDVLSAVLFTHDGRIRYASDPSTVGQLVPHGTPRCAGCHAGGAVETTQPDENRPHVHHDASSRIISAQMPILNEPACHNTSCHVHAANQKLLGVLEVDLSLDKVYRAQRRQWLQMGLLAGGIVILASLAVILLYRRWVTRPVARLVSGTRRIASGTLDHEIPVTEGELGELAQAFNTMQQRLKSTQRQVVVSEKLASLGKLAAGVAHEINNPLTGILTFSEELHDEAAEDDPARMDYEVIRNEALRCREIVSNLLDFSRQKSPSLKLTRVSDVVSSTLKLVAKLATFHDIKLDVQFSTDLPLVEADAGQLQQVFLNLLVNATEAMEGRGDLTIRASIEPETGLVRTSFSDTGPGIPADHIAKIFDPFFSTKGGKTSGLGLAVSWRIIDQHGGRLEVRSGVGGGATFSGSLPPAPPRSLTS